MKYKTIVKARDYPTHQSFETAMNKDRRRKQINTLCDMKVAIHTSLEMVTIQSRIHCQRRTLQVGK